MNNMWLIKQTCILHAVPVPDHEDNLNFKIKHLNQLYIYYFVIMLTVSKRRNVQLTVAFAWHLNVTVIHVYEILNHRLSWDLRYDSLMRVTKRGAFCACAII
jgi:hypothetical protein